MVLRPGFGPGSPARKAGILNRTILPEHVLEQSCKMLGFRFKFSAAQMAEYLNLPKLSEYIHSVGVRVAFTLFIMGT
jgi:hypothetical protein